MDNVTILMSKKQFIKSNVKAYTFNKINLPLYSFNFRDVILVETDNCSLKIFRNFSGQCFEELTQQVSDVIERRSHTLSFLSSLRQFFD